MGVNESRNSKLSVSNVFKVHDDTCVSLLHMPISVESPVVFFTIVYLNKY